MLRYRAIEYAVDMEKHFFVTLFNGWLCEQSDRISSNNITGLKLQSIKVD